ncbi:hypothetical protein [Klebsiella pneumoniae]|nr:hypothetical protein [Klebsiella pneumoniae]
MDFDFVNYSRRSLLLFVMVANIIGWVAIVAVLYVAYLAIEWVAACPCAGDSQCWATLGWHETKLPL